MQDYENSRHESDKLKGKVYSQTKTERGGQKLAWQNSKKEHGKPGKSQKRTTLSGGLYHRVQKTHSRKVGSCQNGFASEMKAAVIKGNLARTGFSLCVCISN